jgi:hypothetical protein
MYIVQYHEDVNLEYSSDEPQKMVKLYSYKKLYEQSSDPLSSSTMLSVRGGMSFAIHSIAPCLTEATPRGPVYEFTLFIRFR